MVKFDLDVYDKLALNMKAPLVAKARTVPLTTLPDDFEPDRAEFENVGEEDIGNIIP